MSGIQPITARTAAGSVTGSWPSMRMLPASGSQQRGEHEQERGLAGAVRPDQRGHLAGAGGQGHVLDGVHVAEGAGDRDDADAAGAGCGSVAGSVDQGRAARAFTVAHISPYLFVCTARFESLAARDIFFGHLSDDAPFRHRRAGFWVAHRMTNRSIVADARGPSAAADACQNRTMAKPVNPPRGMRDFLPEDKRKREAVLSVIRATYRAHGFDEIETPVMEDSDRLHAGLGGDNEKLAFGVLRRGLTADDLAAATDPLDLVDLGLRFDLTVPLARFYATHHAELPAVFRAVQIAPVWRAERPQKGRYRQFLQCDIDIIGEAGPLAEIELIRATGATLDALGLTGWSIRLNDRRILHRILDSWGVAAASRDSALVSLDKEDKIGVAGVAAELDELGLADPQRVTDTLEQLKSLPDDGWALGTRTGWMPPPTPTCSRSGPRCRTCRSSSRRTWSAGWATTPERSSRSPTRPRRVRSAGEAATTG